MLETISLLVNGPKEIFCIVLSHQKGSLMTAVPDMKQQICIYSKLHPCIITETMYCVLFCISIAAYE